MILITGGLGFLGANLAQLLCAQGERVLATSNRNVHIPDFLQPFAGKNLTVAPLDITSLEKVAAAVDDFKITGIVHAAVRSEKGDTPPTTRSTRTSRARSTCAKPRTAPACAASSS